MGDAGDSAGRQSGDARRFAAFISYSHADADAAARLQRRLERYRLPKRIAETRAGDVAALGTIFRDREDFAAAASLSAAIRDAIGRAEALVVLCSPDAAASPWVAAEIELFRELHPEKPILAALLSGKPGVSFPSALISGGSEPLAADLRAEGDGEQLGFLKIVAGIAGVPLDALIQRDAQRRIRRVTTITGAALAAMLTMSIMTTLALQARNEAARQRAAAEGLVEYMLTDLRQKLESVGRLDVMEGVNKRAIEYYGGQAQLDHLSPDSLGRRARILHAMGEDDEKRGDMKLALAKFTEAHRATAAALAQLSEDPSATLAHAQSEYWIGYAKQKSMDSQGALSAYRRYLKLARDAVALGLNRADGLREQGWAHNSLGIIYFEQTKEHTKAKGQFDQYQQVFEGLNRESPNDIENLFSLADAHAWLGQLADAEKQPDIVILQRQRQIAFLQQLLKLDPQNDQAIWSLIGAEREIFRACLTQKQLDCAAKAMARAKQILKSKNFDPANRNWLWQSAYVALDGAFLAKVHGNRAEALRRWQEGAAFASRYEAVSGNDKASSDELIGTVKLLHEKIVGKEI